MKLSLQLVEANRLPINGCAGAALGCSSFGRAFKQHVRHLFYEHWQQSSYANDCNKDSKKNYVDQGIKDLTVNSNLNSSNQPQQLSIQKGRNSGRPKTRPKPLKLSSVLVCVAAVLCRASKRHGICFIRACLKLLRVCGVRLVKIMRRRRLLPAPRRSRWILDRPGDTRATNVSI